MKKLILTMMLLGAATNASAGADGGGGGGGFCINGKCFTLAEVGFNAKAPNTNYAPILIPEPVISKELYNEYQEVADYLLNEGVHFYDVYRVSSQGILNSFIKVNSYNNETLEKIKKVYFDVLKENNFPTENFALFAISTSRHTYLLPEFYKLDLRSQALIMMHELWMQTYLLAAENISYVNHKTQLSYVDALKIILGLDATYLKILNGNKALVWKTLYPASRLIFKDEVEPLGYSSNVILQSAKYQLLSEVIRSNNKIKIPVQLESYLHLRYSQGYDSANLNDYDDYEFFKQLEAHFPPIWNIMTSHGATRIEVTAEVYWLSKELDSECTTLANGSYIIMHQRYEHTTHAPTLISCKNKKRVGNYAGVISFSNKKK